MATATKPPKHEDFEIIDELIENGLRAESILTAIVNEGRKPRYEESQWLLLRCGWSPANVST